MKCLRRILIVASTIAFFVMIHSPDSPAAPTIAVMDFIAKGISDTEASALTDRLRAELVQSGRYDIVEREMMNVILAEQGFQMTGCVSDKCIVAAGQILGAAQMVAGSVSKVGVVYSVSARIVDVQTGKIVKTATYDHEGEIGELLKTGMEYVAKLLTGEIVEEPRKPYDKPSEKKQEPKLSLEQPKTQGSAIGMAWSFPYPLKGEEGKNKGNHMLSLEYSKGLSRRMLFSLEFGFGKLEYKVYSDGSPSSPSGDWKEVDGNQFTLLARFHQMLNAGKRPGISAFVGLGGMRADGISRWTRDYNGIPYISEGGKHHDGFMIIPVGLSVNFANAKRTGFHIDFGYMFSPKDPARDINVNPSGIIASLRTRIRI